MQKQLAKSLQNRFKSEIQLGDVTEERDSSGSPFLSSTYRSDPEFQLSLRFLSGKEEFRLVFTWPSLGPDGLEDLFRFQLKGEMRPAGFWIDSRFLDCVTERLGRDRFCISPPDFDVISAVLKRSRKDVAALRSIVNCSEDKLNRLRDGYYLENPRRITPALRYSLPEWGRLSKAASITQQEARAATEPFSEILRFVESEGGQEFMNRVRQFR